MEKLKIANRTALDFGDQVGIPLERRNELSKKLDEIVKEARSGPVRLIYLIDIIERIDNICENKEEYTWCLVNHLQWMHRDKRMLKPYNRN